jgi:hypothetical protein
VFFFDASNGNYLGNFKTMGSTAMPFPPVLGNPEYMDTDDGRWEIHVVQNGPQVTVYNWI